MLSHTVLVLVHRSCFIYLNKSHSEADSQDHPDVGEEPALHAGCTALNTTQAD